MVSLCLRMQLHLHLVPPCILQQWCMFILSLSLCFLRARLCFHLDKWSLLIPYLPWFRDNLSPTNRCAWLVIVALLCAVEWQRSTNNLLNATRSLNPPCSIPYLLLQSKSRPILVYPVCPYHLQFTKPCLSMKQLHQRWCQHRNLWRFQIYSTLIA
jgi:hypothetical protein